METASTVETPIEQPKKRLNKKQVAMLIVKITLCVIFSIIAVFGGTIVGDLIIGKLDTFDPTQYNESQYYETNANIALWSGKNINNLSALQVFVVAESKILQNTNYAVYTKGYDGGDKGIIITLGLTQYLYGYRYACDGKGYFDYYSTGLATVAKKVEFTLGEDKYYCYEGVVNGTSTDWTPFLTESGQAFRTDEEYKQMVGCSANNPIDYIVSTKTVLSETTNEKVGDYYSYTITLDPETSVLKYVRKMDYMSGFGYPKFSNIELRFEVDENMNFRNIYIHENYKVIGMSADAKFKMEFVYEDFEVR